MSMNTQILVSVGDLTKALTFALRRKVDPKADVNVEVSGKSLVVHLSNISKNFGIGPLSTNVNVKGEIHVHTNAPEIPGTIALAWTIRNVPEIVRPLVEMFVHDALLALDALKGAIIVDASRRGLCVVNPALIVVNGTKLGDVMSVSAVTVPGPQGAALAIEGSLNASSMRT